MERARKRTNFIFCVLLVLAFIAMFFLAFLGRMTVNRKDHNLKVVIESLKINETYVVSSEDYQYLIDRLICADDRGFKRSILFAGMPYNVNVKDSLYILSNIFKPVGDRYTLHVIRKKFVNSTTLLFITKKEGLLKKQ